ncbi:MmcQ/YjbR family DNA-binding protein [Pseudomonas putida]|uniref:MmcQ/YjbR family DNA-binding protein n=1 Tax=Pseudomonas putida TaxID=303 RepID=UPI0018AA2FE4|nr:MmcQ/YjbR family DNA-binding protein [Pseudomonas putida]MBF8668362.1 MmcQ/YjbR family DNA-binding protein [Pseudomonas putida]MBF8710819.1 MmcQ/YjbR family DNA-binding protein [Pseudomonas putida]
MNTEALLKWAEHVGRQCPGVLVDSSSKAGWHSFKVGGRTFMLVSSAPGSHARVVVKIDPIRSEVLRIQHPHITAGGHRMSKRHWISIAPDKSVTKAFIENEVFESFRLVQRGIPVKSQISNRQMPGERKLSERQLQPLARRVALSMPGVSHGRPFVKKLDVFKVSDKVFMIVTDDPRERIITVKSNPQQAQVLRERFDTVTVGRYLDKGHWISVGVGRGITKALITELVKASYWLVVKLMPKHEDQVSASRRNTSID